MKTPPRILIPVSDAFEDLEVYYPKLRLEAAGASIILASPDGKPCKGKHGYPCTADRALPEVRAQDVDGIMVPGGWAPDLLRRLPHLLDVVRYLDERGKLVASICHGPWVLISARILKGRRMTSTPGIKDDVENAGGLWRDDAVVEDGNLITSRRPADLPAFGEAMVAWLKAH